MEAALSAGIGVWEDSSLALDTSSSHRSVPVVPRKPLRHPWAKLCVPQCSLHGGWLRSTLPMRKVASCSHAMLLQACS